MEEKHKVSVIIPIYNVQDYLHECVESIVQQTYKNLEIILVDDGSPDACPTLCDEWERKDNRIITIHKKNGGLSDARNAGLHKASGDYVLYVDSDDYLERDTIEWMISCAQSYEAEIVACTYKKTDDNNIQKLLTKQLVKGTGVEMLEFAFENEIWFAWGKLIKTNIAKQCPFVKGLIYEDVENTPRVFLKASKIVFSLDGRYIYRIRTDSIMGENKNIPKSDIAKVIDLNCEYIAAADIPAMDKNDSVGGAGTGRMCLRCSHTKAREKVLKLYKKWGYKGVEFYFWCRIPKQKVKNVVRRVLPKTTRQKIKKLLHR